MLNEAVPAFSAASSGGETVSSAELLGAPFVLFFYPKDSTPGCTTEACSFRDLKAEFDALGVAVFGISQDSLKRHDNFINKQSLNFPLLSDPEHDVHHAFGTWIEKKNYGRTYMGTQRSTFLVDAKGVVRGEWRKVKVKVHADEVLAAAKAL